jgi:hypothetical protein
MNKNKNPEKFRQGVNLKSKRQRRKAYTRRNKSSSSNKNRSSSNKSNSLNGVFRTVLTPKKRKVNSKKFNFFGF